MVKFSLIYFSDYSLCYFFLDNGLFPCFTLRRDAAVTGRC